MENTISGIDLNDYAVEGTALEDGDLMLKSVPLCPACSHPIMPQSVKMHLLCSNLKSYFLTKCTHRMSFSSTILLKNG